MKTTGIAGMRPALFIPAVILLLIAGFLVYAVRAQIAARFWHWRYGYSTVLNDFVVPVPDYWLVKDVDDPSSVFLVDTRMRSGGHFSASVNVIDVIAETHPTANVELWASARRERLEKDGLKSIEAKTFYAGDEKIACIGGQEFREIHRVPGSPPVSLVCRSTMGLNLNFVGSQEVIQEFYAIASQIRRKNGKMPLAH